MADDSPTDERSYFHCIRARGCEVADCSHISARLDGPVAVQRQKTCFFNVMLCSNADDSFSQRLIFTPYSSRRSFATQCRNCGATVRTIYIYIYICIYIYM